MNSDLRRVKSVNSPHGQTLGLLDRKHTVVEDNVTVSETLSYIGDAVNHAGSKSVTIGSYLSSLIYVPEMFIQHRINALSLNRKQENSKFFFVV